MTQKKAKPQKSTASEEAKEPKKFSLKGIKFKNQKQRQLYDTIIDNKIIFVTGSAGTGKTFVAIYAALKLLYSDNKPKITKLIFSKPIIEAAKSIGFLPGSVEEKVAIYMHSFYDNLKYMLPDEEITKLKQDNIIKEVALNFVRGNTFGSKNTTGESEGYFCILDEAQNCTIKEMKLFLSRKAENSKMVILGDIDQSDLVTKNELCGLEDAVKRFKGMPGVGHIEFTDDEIVRDPFMIELMKRYKMSYDELDRLSDKFETHADYDYDDDTEMEADDRA